MPNTLDTNEVLQWRGRKAVDADGSKFGKIDEIYVDSQTERPEWARVDGHTFVPLAEASAEGRKEVRFPFSTQQLESAPRPAAEGELSQEEEGALYRHYGLDYSESRSDSGLPAGHAGAGGRGAGNDVSGAETDEAMTRSEEELRVGTSARESGRARLRKHVVTEQVETTVPVQREEVRIEREPITDANMAQASDGPAISEEEHEVTLMQEEVVTEKRAVPKERVRMSKDTVTEERQVSEQVRKEQIDEVDGEGAPARGVDGERGTDAGVDRR